MSAARVVCVALVCLVFGHTGEGARARAPQRPCHYRIQTVSDGASAAAGAKVFIEVTGASATCPWKELKSGGTDFQAGQTDNFAIVCPCVGHYASLKIRYESGTGSTAPAWHPKTVGILEWPYKLSYHKYYWEDWASTSSGVSESEPLTRSDCVYGIRTLTAKHPHAATSAKVEIKLFGTKATCPWRQLDPPGHIFRRDRIDYFNITCPCLGYYEKMGVRHDNSGPKPAWLLKQIHVNEPVYRTTVDYHVFRYYKWLGRWRNTLSVVLKPRIKYRFAVYTSKRANADTRARVQIRVRNSDRTSRPMNLKNKNKVDFQRGAIDQFYVNGDEIGNVTQIVVRHNNRGWGPSWFVDQIIVHNTAMNELFLCICNKWLKRGSLKAVFNCAQYF